jgi:hypothetical protein
MSNVGSMPRIHTRKTTLNVPNAFPRVREPVAGQVGPGTSYRREFARIARGFALLGGTHQQIADLFGVEADTITNWKRKHPAFRRALEEGGAWADGQVAAALYRRAIGMRVITTTTETQETRDNAGNVTGTTTTTTTAESEIPPHTSSCWRWLHLRQGWDVNATRTVFTMADVLSVLTATKLEMRRRGLVGREGMSQALEDVQRRSRPRCPECGAMMFGPVDDDL